MECGKNGYETAYCSKEQQMFIIHQGINTSEENMLAILHRQDILIKTVPGYVLKYTKHELNTQCCPWLCASAVQYFIN